MPSPVLPTYAAGTWDHLNTIQNVLFMQDLAFPAKIAAPTYVIMTNNMTETTLNTDGTLVLPIDLSVNPTTYATGVNIIYDTEHDEETTRASYRPGLAYSGNAISEIQVTGGGEFSDEATLIPELETRQRAANRGLSLHCAYEIWAKQGYTLSTGVAAEPTDSTINISNIMQNVYLNARIKNRPASVVNRFHSLPTICQAYNGSNTYAGISLENLWWRTKVYANGAPGTITEISSDNYTLASTWCASAPTDIPGLVTNPIYLFSDWNMRNIDLWLDQLQQGGGFELYIAVPPTGYSAMLAWVRDNMVASENEKMTDMGIKQNFTHSSYNATFYSDPTMTYIYPNSLFAYDPEVTHYVAVEGFAPLVKGWQPVPGTSSIVTAKILRKQLCSTMPVSCGALHGITWD